MPVGTVHLCRNESDAPAEAFVIGDRLTDLGPRWAIAIDAAAPVGAS